MSRSKENVSFLAEKGDEGICLVTLFTAKSLDIFPSKPYPGHATEAIEAYFFAQESSSTRVEMN